MNPIPEPLNIRRPLNRRYRSVLLVSFASQAVFLMLGALAFDMGVSLRIACYAMLPFWVLTALIVRRRPEAPTEGDVLFLKYGFAAIFTLLFALNLAMGG